MNKKNSVCRAEPIRDKQQIEDMKKHLLINNERDYLLFVLGINSGLHISDLLKLTVENTRFGKVVLIEKQTKKVREFMLSKTCMKAIHDYLKHTGIKEGTLFPSRSGGKVITSRQAWYILKQAAKFVGIKENVGTHTLRKTFAFWALRQGVDIAYIMQCLNHSSPAMTKRYIGITTDELNEVVYKNMNL